jgi:hypothetical protein
MSSKLFSVTFALLAPLDAGFSPLALGTNVNPGVQPGYGTSLAGLNKSRSDSLRMLRNLGAPIHCFGQLMRAIFLRLW